MVHGFVARALPELALWALGRRARFRVHGSSMSPALAPGDQILVDLVAYRRARPRVGDVVLAHHPYRRDVRLVKRVARVEPDGRCELAGDDPAASTDSRGFGAVPADLLLGRVVLRLGRARGRRIPRPTGGGRVAKDRSVILAIAALVAAVAGAPAFGKPIDNSQKLDVTGHLRTLVDVEHAFAKAVAAHGVRDGFLAYLADDGVLFRPGPVNGKQATAARAASKASLGWEPTFADVSRTGDLGYTTGPWELRPKGPQDKATAFGDYVTLWRRQSDGAWKVVLDAGISHSRPAAKARPYQPRPAGGATVLRPAADPDSERVALLQVDRDFSAAAAAKGVAPAYEAFAARDLRLYREGQPPLVGLSAARPVLQAHVGRLAWEPIGGAVARACDLGYTYGSYHAAGTLAGADAGEGGYYTRIWKRQTNGAWGVVLDLLIPTPEPEGKQ